MVVSSFLAANGGDIKNPGSSIMAFQHGDRNRAWRTTRVAMRDCVSSLFLGIVNSEL